MSPGEWGWVSQACCARSGGCSVLPTWVGSNGAAARGCWQGNFAFVNIWDRVLFRWVAGSQAEVFGTKTNPLQSSRSSSWQLCPGFWSGTLGVRGWAGAGGLLWGLCLGSIAACAGRVSLIQFK